MVRNTSRTPARAHVRDVRVLGAIGVVELVAAVDLKQVQPLFVEQGVWLRPFRWPVYLMPPFVINGRFQGTDGCGCRDDMPVARQTRVVLVSTK